MKTKLMYSISIWTVVAWCGVQPVKAQNLDTAKIEKLTGLKGTFDEGEGVFKVTSPRTDIPVTIDQWKMAPFMGLTSWAGFQKGKAADAMVMGDLVLFQDEVNPVMSELFGAGVSVTALHNHFFYDEPKVYFMHIGGEGETQALALGVRKAFDKMKEIRAAHPEVQHGFGGEPLSQASSITGKVIEDAIGVKGQAKDGMFKVTIGRKVKSACGCEVGKEMGVNTWAAFMGSDDNAVVDGDFAVHEDELQGVLKSLRGSGINIVAIHHHMTLETPRTLFLHYWGKGKAGDLAKGVKAALDTQK
jgi:uncharacterized protein DUF1259